MSGDNWNVNIIMFLKELAMVCFSIERQMMNPVHMMEMTRSLHCTMRQSNALGCWA